MTEAQASLNIAFTKWEQELAAWVARVTRPDAVLRLDYHPGVFPGAPFLVRDTANGGEVMVACQRFAQALKWMLAFQSRTPGASADMASIESVRAIVAENESHSVRVPRLRAVEAAEG